MSHQNISNLLADTFDKEESALRHLLAKNSKVMEKFQSNFMDWMHVLLDTYNKGISQK